MSVMMIMLIIWGAVTAVLIILLIYRGTLTMHEDDQLFLDEAESHMQHEQAELQSRMNKIEPLVKLFGAGSGLILLVIAALWIYQGINQT